MSPLVLWFQIRHIHVLSSKEEAVQKKKNETEHRNKIINMTTVTLRSSLLFPVCSDVRPTRVPNLQSNLKLSLTDWIFEDCSYRYQATCSAAPVATWPGTRLAPQLTSLAGERLYIHFVPLFHYTPRLPHIITHTRQLLFLDFKRTCASAVDCM